MATPATGEVLFYSDTMVGHWNVYGNANAPKFSMHKSGDFPSTPYAVTKAVLYYTVRTASARNFRVYRTDTNQELGVCPGSVSNWDISTSANYVGISQICLQGVGGDSCQLTGGTNISIKVWWQETTTACTAPTSITLGAAIAEGTTSISWSGASGGVNNGITSYLLQYCDSTDKVNWDAWKDYATYTSTNATVYVNGWRGGYRKFRVRAQGQAGSAWYSGFKESSAVRTNAIPSTPAPSVDKTLFESGSIKISWSAATDATDTIKQYEVQSRTYNGISWSAWSGVATTTSTSYSHSPSLTRGNEISYRVRAVDSYNVAGDYGETGAVTRNSLPTKPTNVKLDRDLFVSGSIKISWDAVSDADGNFSRYHVQFCTSSDGANWGSWAERSNPYTVSTDYSDSPVLNRGQYIKYRVCSEDDLGVSSDFEVTAAIRRNSCPTIPNAVAVSPAIYESGAVSLSWSASSDADGNLVGYRVYLQTSPDNASWTSPALLAEVTSNAASVEPTITRGSYARFIVEAYDGADGVSTQTVSGSIRRNSLPKCPSILWPCADSSCGSGKPFVFFSLAAETDNQQQTVQMRVINAQNAQVMAYTSVSSIQGTGTSGMLTRCPQLLPDGSYTLYLRTVDALGAVSSSTVSVPVKVESHVWKRAIARGTVISQGSNAMKDNVVFFPNSVLEDNGVLALPDGMTLSDGILTISVAGVSHQEDMRELLAEVNRCRAYVSLSDISFQQAIGYFARWLPQMQELQAALSSALALTGQSVAWRTQTGNYPEAETFNQIREATKMV